MADYTRDNFAAIFALHPENRGVVMAKDSEVASHRWHQAYLRTPTRCGGDHSYMFSGEDESSNGAPLPEILVPLLDYMNTADSTAVPYNQVVVNWYQDGTDYIAMHSDYARGLIKGSDIAVVSLHEEVGSSPDGTPGPGTDGTPDPSTRTFTVKARTSCKNSCYRKIEVNLRHGTVVRMKGDTQTHFRHGVRKTVHPAGRRVSLTVRSYT